MVDSASPAVSGATTSSPATSGTAAGGDSTGATSAKVSAFQLALQNAMNRTPPLTDGGGTDDDNDDGTSLSIGMGTGFPMP